MDFSTEFGARVGPLLAWARYVSWADLMDRVHHERLSRHAVGGRLDQVAARADSWPLWALTSYSYASLYVAIEGYEELNLADPTVDELLKSDKKEVLKRYRNGVFHFQKQFLDDRFINLITDEEHVKWVSAVRGALIESSSRELGKVVGGTDDEMRQFRSAVQGIFGWADRAV